MPHCPNCQSTKVVKKVASITASKTINAVTVVANLSKILNRKSSPLKPSNQLTSYSWKRFLWLVLPEFVRFQSLCCNSMSIRNMKPYRDKYRCHQKKGRLTIQCDEMWSFVGNQQQKCWICLDLDVDTHEIVGLYVGDRSEFGASRAGRKFLTLSLMSDV